MDKDHKNIDFMAVSGNDISDDRGDMAGLDEYSHAAHRRILRDSDRGYKPVAEILQMQNSLAVPYRNINSSGSRIYFGVRIEFMAWAGDMGLHGNVRQYFGAGMRTVRDTVVFSDTFRYMGRGLYQARILAGKQSVYAAKHIQRTFYV